VRSITQIAAEVGTTPPRSPSGGARDSPRARIEVLLEGAEDALAVETAIVAVTAAIERLRFYVPGKLVNLVTR
jgi:hypothetical protein